MAIVTTFLEPGTDATQDLSFYATSSGTVASATDQVHDGTHALKFSLGSPATPAFVTTPSGLLADSGSQLSIWFYTDTLGLTSPWWAIRDASGNNICTVTFVAGVKAQLNPTGATAVTGTTVLAANTWYRFSISYYITNTTTFTFRLYLNGTLEATASAGTLTRTGSSQAKVGPTAVWGANTNVWVDSFYMATGGASSSAQPDVAHRDNVWSVTAKRPNANGTANNFVTQIGAGGSGYGSGHAPQVNEQPLSTTNGWSVVAVGSAVTEEYTIEDPATGDVDMTGRAIIDYMGWVYTKALAAETGQIVVNGASSAIAITTANALFTKAAGSTTYPAGTGTDIGIVTDTTVTTVSLFECGMLFVYTDAAESPYYYRDVAALGGMATPSA